MEVERGEGERPGRASKQTGMMPVASLTQCCKSRCFVPEAYTLR